MTKRQPVTGAEAATWRAAMRLQQALGIFTTASNNRVVVRLSAEQAEALARRLQGDTDTAEDGDGGGAA